MSARPASRPARIVHYEILVNGRFVDPMRVRLPRGRVLEGRCSPASSRSATASTT